MKKIFFTLFILAGFVSAQAETIAEDMPQKAKEEAFLKIVQEGRTLDIAFLKDESLLKATDRFGNNVFHYVQDVYTLQTLSARVREKDRALLFELLNSRNQMGETPFMRYVNYSVVHPVQFDANVFFKLYEGTQLDVAVREAYAAMEAGGAMKFVLPVKMALVRELSFAGGRSIVQAALANEKVPGMHQVIDYFKIYTPYLFK